MKTGTGQIKDKSYNYISIDLKLDIGEERSTFKQ